MRKWITKFSEDQSGATAIEYVIISFIIVIAIVAGSTSIGEVLNNFFIDAGKAFK
jgi:Flp pilus assembly pilin Flp